MNFYCNLQTVEAKPATAIDVGGSSTKQTTENRGPRPTALYPNPRNNGACNNETRLYYNGPNQSSSDTVI